MSLSAEIRSRLEIAIRERNTTPKEVSIAAGFAPAYLRNLLRRKSAIRTGSVLKLAKALNVSLDWLVCGTGPMCWTDAKRKHIGVQIFKAIDAKCVGFDEIAAYVRVHSGTYVITDDELQETARWLIEIWDSRDRSVQGEAQHAAA